MSWSRFKQYYYHNAPMGFSLDISRMDFDDDFLITMEPEIQAAYRAMADLEGGFTANPDENRMVGHYWLRAPELAPTGELTRKIRRTVRQIRLFAGRVHGGEITGQSGPFQHLLVVGIGGSALGPQFVADALGHPKRDHLALHFFDNTDPDGMDRTLSDLDGELGRTLCAIISKSGGTAETRNGMLEAKRAYAGANLDFSRHALAITEPGSKLDRLAEAEDWVGRFPLWDWVGGRTSQTSAVGLIPAALQGIDVERLLEGAACMDVATRSSRTRQNPAALLALMWHHATGGEGAKAMVIVPYKDRLQLFAKYLQQLVMESLGKELDLDGNTVNQGITVYGNKGSTDQHAYLQQLREGVHNFFVTFIQVLKDRHGPELKVEPGITTGDYLNSFLLGTRSALHSKQRQSITITIDEVRPFSIGLLIALYERAVGFYASLVNINAYHQPGVEAGKKAASQILELQKKVVRFLAAHAKSAHSAEEVARGLGRQDETETVFKLLEHLAGNPSRGVSCLGTGPETRFTVC